MTATPNNPSLDAAVGLPTDDAPVQSHRAEGAGLKKKALNAGKWTSLSFFFDQGLSFLSNIVLVYLALDKADFGIMVLVAAVNTGLQQFSDVGITPCLIQNKREDEAFYNTAWTMQVIRGVFLWLIACVIAYPMSQIKPDWAPLAWVLPVACFTAVLQGFRSTAFVTVNRRLNIKSIALIKVVASVVRILAMLGIAVVSPSYWALVGGLLAGSLTTCVLSHRILPEIKNRFRFEREAFGTLIRYGRWLFLSTVIGYFAGQIDKLMLGGLISVSALGVFWIGSRFAEIGPMFFKKIGAWVGFPALTDVYRRDPERFKHVLLKMRMALTLPINGVLLLMIATGPLMCYLFYGPSPTPAFIEAGWIIQVLCFNSLAGMTTTSYGHVFMATGRTKFNMLSVLAQLIAMLAATLTGYYLAGETGFLLGIGVSQWLKYVSDAAMAKTCGCWQWKFDAVVLVGCGLLAWAAVWFSNLLAWSFVL
ncbi:MAG: oligosaccharide flippase family protein [Planctomycetota bacterium]